jgi:hypothetical protein
MKRIEARKGGSEGRRLVAALVGAVASLAFWGAEPVAARDVGSANPEHARCARLASEEFGVPLIAILALLDTEGGWAGAEIENPPLRDGTVTYDLGPMQVNDHFWGPVFARVGVTRDMLRDDVCTNLHAGTYILWSHWRRIKLERELSGEPVAGALGEAMLRYHSKTASLQAIYAEKVKRALAQGLRTAARPADNASAGHAR